MKLFIPALCREKELSTGHGEIEQCFDHHTIVTEHIQLSVFSLPL